MAGKYVFNARVVFSFLSPEGNVSHIQYAKLFGDVRELFGLDVIPGFKDEVGKRYLLKTKEASFNLNKDFFFGDTIQVQMSVVEVNGASFRLKADFVNPKTGVIHASATQLIVFANMEGRAVRLPEGLRRLLKGVMGPLETETDDA